MSLCATTKPGIACCKVGCVSGCQCNADDVVPCAVATNTAAVGVLGGIAVSHSYKTIAPFAHHVATVATKHPAIALTAAATAVVGGLVFGICYRAKQEEIGVAVDALNGAKEMLDDSTSRLEIQSERLAEVTEKERQTGAELNQVKNELNETGARLAQVVETERQTGAELNQVKNELKETNEKYQALLAEQKECQVRLQQMLAECGEERAALHDLSASNRDLVAELSEITLENRQLVQELKAENAEKNAWVDMLNITVSKLGEAVLKIQDDFQGPPRLQIAGRVEVNKSMRELLEEINSKFDVFRDVREMLKKINPHEQVSQIVELGKQNVAAQQNLIRTQEQIQTGLANCLDSLATALTKINQEMAQSTDQASIKTCEARLQEVLDALQALRSN